MSSEVVPHGPLFTVHRIVTLPVPSPVSVAAGSLALEMVAVPATTVQVPAAGKATALPANTVLDAPHSDWSGPALAAAVAGLNRRIVTSLVVVAPGDGGLLIRAVVPSSLI
mgnify:CR=1 FL=1